MKTIKEILGDQYPDFMEYCTTSEKVIFPIFLRQTMLHLECNMVLVESMSTK